MGDAAAVVLRGAVTSSNEVAAGVLKVLVALSPSDEADASANKTREKS